MKVYYSDNLGKIKPVWFGSYGIGITRAIGICVEVSHDDRGIIWNKAVAPFQVHLIELKNSAKEGETKLNADEVYRRLTEAGIDVLWDDREVGAGVKFADSDLIGIPVRLVISEKTGGKLEWKNRNSDSTEVLDIEEVLKKLNES
jgi:prolyl-tRNA synthetase